MSVQTESDQGAPILNGTANSNKPKRRVGNPLSSTENIGEDALRDGIILVLFAWLFLFFLAWSLRHHNN